MIPPTLEQQIQQQISETRPQLRPRVASLPVITTINTQTHKTPWNHTQNPPHSFKSQSPSSWRWHLPPSCLAMLINNETQNIHLHPSMIKTIHFYPRGSPTAVKQGYPDSGCFAVETSAPRPDHPMRVEAAFETHDEALAHFETFPAIACKVWAKLNRPNARRGPAWLDD